MAYFTPINIIIIIIIPGTHPSHISQQGPVVLGPVQIHSEKSSLPWRIYILNKTKQVLALFPFHR